MTTLLIWLYVCGAVMMDIDDGTPPAGWRRALVVALWPCFITLAILLWLAIRAANLVLRKLPE